MSGATIQFRFPTRQYPYRPKRPGAALDTQPDPLSGVPPGSIVRFFLGVDDAPVVLPPETLADTVNDPFARIVLMTGQRPNTLIELLAVLNAAPAPDNLPVQCIYRAADGGQIAWTNETAALDRHLRLIVTRQKGDEAELFIATAPPFSSSTIFLQIFSWDPKLGAFNFYERRRGIWSWAGSSWQALEPGTRGQGPFDSHINGGPVMKELKLPWMHWHSQAAQIRDDILAPEDPLRTDPIYQSADLKGGEDLERIVRAGISRWTASRFARRTVAGGLERAPEFLRHVLETTTVNLASSPQESAALDPAEMLRLPTTFFLNSDCLVDELRLPVVLGRQKALASSYQLCVEKYGVCLQDETFTLKQDTHFAFAVPEPSFEDQMVLRDLLVRGALSRKLALCMLMVDFPNPVFSSRRATLLRHVPQAIALGEGQDLDRRFVGSVRVSSEANTQGSPEGEFLAMWDRADWEANLADRVNRYWTSIGSVLSSAEGFDQVFRLAESRRRQFRKRPVLEFGLTLAAAIKMALPRKLQMTDDAQVEEGTAFEESADGPI